MKRSLVSVIVVTFNSSRLLPQVLTAITNQTYPRESIEILVVDGGSKDTTVEIAKKFGCRVIRNPKVEPLYARYLAYTQARGKYLLSVDHDEVLLNPKSIQERVEMFQANRQTKAVTGNGYRNPKGYGIINRYINEYGDAFSFFVYRLSKNEHFFVPSMRRRYRVPSESSSYVIFDLSSSTFVPLVELAAGGGMIDASFFRKNFPNILTHYHLIPHFLHLLRPIKPNLAIMKNDPLLHYSPDDLKGYINKLVWRIKNNIFYTDTIGASGYKGREEYQTGGFRLKKYLFIPYAFSLILPIIDASYLSITRRDAGYLIHVPLTLITAGLIMYFGLLRVAGIRPVLRSYDGSVRAYENK